MTAAMKATPRHQWLDSVLNPLGDKASTEYPDLWNERAQILRVIRAQEQIAEKQRLAKEAEKRAADFMPSIAEFRKRAQITGNAFATEASALVESLTDIKTLMGEYNTLWREGTAAGAIVPSLAELSGLGDRRLQRVELAIHLLALGDE